MSRAADEVAPSTAHGARGDAVLPAAGAPAVARPAPTPTTWGYRTLVAILLVAVAVLVWRLPDPPVIPTSQAYLLGFIPILLVVPWAHSRAVRVPGTPVSEMPEGLMTVPLLLVAPMWVYIAAMAWLTVGACLRLRVRPVNLLFNLGATTASACAAAYTFSVVAGSHSTSVNAQLAGAALAASVVCYVVNEIVVYAGCVVDGKRQVAPTVSSAVVRFFPAILSVGLGLCAVSMADDRSALAAVLGHTLLIVVLLYLTLQARAANQRWVAEQLYVASERIRSESDPAAVPDALGRELGTLWQARTWSVTRAPSRGEEAYRLDGDTYVTVVPGEGVPTRLTRQAATSLATTAADVLRSLIFEDELRQRATRDTLTGLGNRHRLWETLDDRLPQAGRGHPLVVMSLDVDSFKAINDTYGHALGDQLLVAVAQRLTDLAQPGDVVCRIGGDEFVVVASVGQGVGEALRRAHRVQRDLSVPFALDQSVVNITCSLGVHYVDQTTTRASALSSADAALSRSKSSGRGTVTLATEEVVLQARRLLRLDAELRAAMHRGEFTLHYQPMVDGRRGRAFAVEALLRWERDGVVQMGPADFIPYAEHSGLVSTIGLWVLRRACQQIHAYNQQHRPDDPLRVSVNISTVHIAQPSFVEDVERILRETGLAPELLILEITETFATLDLDASVDTGRRLREIGVRLWLDDFGTGYSSLEYLRQLPVEVIKLDRGFLADIDSDPTARGFVESIVHLCRSIGREPLAEGVETLEQRAILTDLGCTDMQGYLFSRPVPFHRLQATVDPPARPGERSA